MSLSTASPDTISRLNAVEKQTKDDISRQKSLLFSIQSNYRFLYDKIRQLEAGSNKTIVWRMSCVCNAFCVPLLLKGRNRSAFQAQLVLS